MVSISSKDITEASRSAKSLFVSVAVHHSLVNHPRQKDTRCITLLVRFHEEAWLSTQAAWCSFDSLGIQWRTYPASSHHKVAWHVRHGQSLILYRLRKRSWSSLVEWVRKFIFPPAIAFTGVVWALPFPQLVWGSLPFIILIYLQNSYKIAFVN